MRALMCPNPIALVQAAGGPDQFAGVDGALRQRGLNATRYVSPQTPPVFDDRTRLVVVADLESFLCRRALREARRVGATSVLLMDGLLEYRNTFHNPRNDNDFMRPAPVDVIAAAGAGDRDRLVELGNARVVATGLPRLDRLSFLPARRADRSRRPRLLVATARTPYFSAHEKYRVLTGLRLLACVCAAHGIDVIWRLNPDLDESLDVASDARSITEILADIDAVFTTPSTLLLESMKLGRPTAIVDPFDAPLWPRSGWIWKPNIDTERASPAELMGIIESMLDPSDEDWARQRAALDSMHASGPAAESLAELLVQLVEDRTSARAERSIGSRTPLADPRVLPERVARANGRARILNCVFVDDSLVGGVSVWARRLSAAFAERSPGRLDVHTLVISTVPRKPASLHSTFGADHVSLCVIDPTDDHAESLERVAMAIERLEPDLILPNYIDLVYAASVQAQQKLDARIVAIAHTDDDYYRRLISLYDRWDAAVGVSDACVDWLAPIAGGRPIHQIVYGVPIATRPRRSASDQPLRIAYIGRITQKQKRVFDLLDLIDALERREVRYEFHLIGDGADLPAWRAALARRMLESGRVVVHGSRDPHWIEQRLPMFGASVLVSDSEGASLSMLEAMGAGVTPVVTRVSSGVSDWIDDGVHGVVVPIGDLERMADRLAALAVDRAALDRLGHAAWNRARELVSVDRMADAYASLFEEVLSRPRARTAPTDLGVRLFESWRWQKGWSDNPDRTRARIHRMLNALGFARTTDDAPASDGDAVMLTDADPALAASLRERGYGVANAPALLEADEAAAGQDWIESIVGGASEEGGRAGTVTQPFTVWRLKRALDHLVQDGAQRIVIYGIGQHTRRASVILNAEYPIVGFMDDRPPADNSFLGLPVATPETVVERLAPDAIVISSDAWEDQMFDRCAELRRRGVRVARIYGSQSAATETMTA